jgi:hypothetical protein
MSGRANNDSAKNDKEGEFIDDMPVEEGEKQVLNIFTTAGIETPQVLRATNRLMRDMIREAIYSSGGTKVTKADADETASKFIDIMKLLQQFVARNPKLVGDASIGVPKDTVKVVFAELLEATGSICKEPQSVQHRTLGLVAATWLQSIAETDPSAASLVTMESIVKRTGYRTQYYASTVVDIYNKIRADYHGTKINVSEKVRVCVRDLGSESELETHDSILGHCQVIGDFLEDSVITLDESLYRRDTRSLKAGYSTPSRVAVLTITAMRKIITSALQMSIALGNVSRISVPSTSKDAPAKIEYQVNKSSDFYRLMEFARINKSVQNLTGAKDAEETKMLGGGRGADGWWKSIDENENYLKCKSASLAIEIETRLRIAEYKAEDAVAGGIRPSARTVGIPAMTAFMKNPNELCRYCDRLESKSYTRLLTEAPQRKEFQARLTAIYDKAGNDTAFKLAITEHRDNVLKLAKNIVLIYLMNAVFTSVADCSINAACVSVGRRRTTGPKM